jgi:tripartite-type tricarboxylate transporter receptor subunit TctC
MVVLRSLAVISALGWLVGLAPIGSAQEGAWPTGTVRIVVPYAPGGPVDPALTSKASAVGLTMMLAPADELRARLEADVPRWRELVPQLGLKAE